MDVLGFDFGTTNSLISIARGDGPVNFLDEDGERPIPSIVCYEGTETIVGRNAKERLAVAGLGVHGNIVRSPKMYLGQESVFVAGVEKNPVSMVADIVRYVLREARNQPRAQDTGIERISAAVVTIPIDMPGYKRRALRDAFRRADLRIVQFVHEPLAALYGWFRTGNLHEMLHRYEGKLILVADWGGGTLDLTLCRLAGDMVVQLKNDGTDEVGGDRFDDAVMNYILGKVERSRGYESTVTRYPGAEPRLRYRCEEAKIALSGRSSTEIYVSGFFCGTEEEDFESRLERSDLENIVRPLLDKGFERISHILEDAGYSPEQVALCIATGGMSNMPAVRSRLHELFGPARVAIPDNAATLIAEGAAWIAADEARLQLAKNTELLLARNSYLTVVKAGARMPKEGDELTERLHLYCTDPRDGVAKIQICAPRRPGSKVLRSEPRVPLENLTVKVDAKAQAFQERLELDVLINDDLIMTAHARSLNRKDESRCEVHDLEFGLSVRTNETDEERRESLDDVPGAENTSLHAVPSTTVAVRANVADREDLSLVPGELLYQHDPNYFDVRRNPPEEQVREHLYYKPCSSCGRASNDPACRCDSP